MKFWKVFRTSAKLLSQGVTFVAYVTADISCSSKHMAQPVGTHVDNWPFCGIYLLCDYSNLMTIVRLCVFTYLDVFWCVLGEVVLSDWIEYDHVDFGANVSCAPVNGGKKLSSPHSGFIILTGVDNKLTVCQ